MSPRNKRLAKDTALRDEAKLHMMSFLLWKRKWSLYKRFLPQKNLSPLNWQVFEFNSATATVIPTSAGVYAFLLQPRVDANLPVSYLLYIGKTSRSLRTRYREYLNQSDAGRTHIYDMFRLYTPGYVVFACAPLKMPNRDIKEVEDHLIRCYRPPLNQELPVGFKNQMPAF